MTYNFDLEQWFRIRESALQKQLDSGEIEQDEFEKRHKELIEKYEELQRQTDIKHDYY